MNNYIPLNRAVGPVCIYDGSEPLIDKKLGVEATECRFDGSECEHASCSGAPEMFIKVEEDGLYYFGLEADDKGFLKTRVRKSASKMVFPLTDAWNWSPGQET